MVTCVDVTLLFCVKLASNKHYSQDPISEVPLQANWTLILFMVSNEFYDNSFPEEGIFLDSLSEQINNG
jgi:hypothetical protein